MISKKNKKFLIVKTNFDEYLIPLHYILFIEKLEYNGEGIDKRIKPFPNPPDYFRGFIRFKKTTFPILEMEQILNNKETHKHSENKIVFIHTSGQKFGLLFNDVVEITAFDFEDEDLKLNNNQPIYINSIENHNYFLIDVVKLSKIPEFNNYLRLKD